MYLIMGKILEIKVGTVFTVEGIPGRTDIIIDTKRRNYFDAVQCEVNPYKIISIPGTGGPDNIGSVIAEIGRDVVEKLLIEYWENEVGTMDARFKKIIHDSTLSKPRRMELP